MEPTKKVQKNVNTLLVNAIQPRSRNWITTINNPTPTAKDAFDYLRTNKLIKFACG